MSTACRLRVDCVQQVSTEVIGDVLYESDVYIDDVLYESDEYIDDVMNEINVYIDDVCIKSDV